MLPGTEQDQVTEKLAVLVGQLGQNLSVVDEERWPSQETSDYLWDPHVLAPCLEASEVTRTRVAGDLLRNRRRRIARNGRAVPHAGRRMPAGFPMERPRILEQMEEPCPAQKKKPRSLRPAAFLESLLRTAYLASTALTTSLEPRALVRT